MTNKTFINKEGKEIERTPCQVFTRVMGYLRPVSHYNIGKKSEFYSRKYFQEAKSANSQFVAQYSFVGCGCN
jgi:hypothetical protein